MGKIDNLMEGFLTDRDQETFVSASTHNRLGWEDTLEEEDSYSTFMLGRREYSDRRKHEIAHGMCRSVVSVMDVDQKVNVSFNKKNNFYDGKSIFIATEVLDDTELTFGEQLDVIQGLTVHETAHADSTDMGLLKRFLDKNGKDTVKKNIYNIVEDERIERIVGEKTPGYSRYLEKTKSYMYDKKYLDEVPDEDKMTDTDKLMDTILKMIRYPKYLDENTVEKYEQELLEIKDMFLDNFADGFPQTQAECEKAVDEIYSVIERHCEKKSSEDSEGGKESGGKPEMSEDMDKAMSKVAEPPAEFGDDSTPSRESSWVKDHSTEASIVEESMDYEKESNTTFEIAPNDKAKYEYLRKKVTAYSSTLSRVLRWESKNKIDTLTRLKSGSLDTNFLVEAKQRVDNVYSRTRKVRSEKISICLLLDESGSMSGNNIEAARQTSVLFIEALKKVPHVDLFIYGHTADRSSIFGEPDYDAEYDNRTNIIVYKEPGVNNEESVASAEARWQNRDGVAIIEVANRVRKFTSNKVLYLVLSDGQPAAGNYRNGIEHTRKMVLKAEKMGMHVVQVAIEAHCQPERMFNNYVKFTNIGNLSKDMGKLMRKLVTKLSSAIVD